MILSKMVYTYINELDHDYLEKIELESPPLPKFKHSFHVPQRSISKYFGCKK